MSSVKQSGHSHSPLAHADPNGNYIIYPGGDHARVCQSCCADDSFITTIYSNRDISGKRHLDLRGCEVTVIRTSCAKCGNVSVKYRKDEGKAWLDCDHLQDLK